MENAELDGLSDWIYDKITETSKMAQKVYAIYLSGVAYGLLTIFTITDLQLVVNERIRLPIINMDLPVTVFFVLTVINSGNRIFGVKSCSACQFAVVFKF